VKYKGHIHISKQKFIVQKKQFSRKLHNRNSPKFWGFVRKGIRS